MVITLVEKQTVQVLEDAKQNPMGSVLTDWYVEPTRQAILPRWGTRWREKVLRAIYRDPYNTLVQGIIQGQTKKIKSTPWEIVGGKTRTTYFSGILRDAQFGRGWGDFISRVMTDYLRHDIGAFVEVIAPGNPLRPPTGRVTGLAHLDSLKCYPTGDPQYPVLYEDKNGKMHLLHSSRVMHFVDMPDGDEDYRDYGLCALSRAIAVVERQMLMARYIRINLDDDPKPGMITASNMTRIELMRSKSQYDADQNADTRMPWGKVMWFFGTDPEHPAKLEALTFNTAPEGWDYPKYMDIDVNQLATAFGIDKQEIWELNGVNVGSATQSVILDAKSKGKAFADYLTMWERELNRALLPLDLDFKWKPKDSQQEEAAAANAKVWVEVGVSLQTMGFPTEAVARILANQVPAISDAIIDQNGNLIRMNDLDPESTETPPAQIEAPADQNTQNDVVNRRPGVAGSTGVKDIQATRLDFESDFEDVLSNARKGVYKKARLRSILLNLIRQYGEKAFLDGKQAGGVDEPLTDDEEARFTVLLASQREYVNTFVDTLLETGISDTSAVEKPAMWFTKSIQPFEYAGKLSADANGMYEFGGEDGEESCATCQMLKGQRHRMKEWTDAQLRPGADTSRFDCRGFKCRHRLFKVKGRPRGRLPAMKEMTHVL